MAAIWKSRATPACSTISSKWCCSPGRSSTRYLKYFTGVLLNRLRGMKGVTVLRAKKVCFSPAADARVYIQVDGEYAGRLPGSVEIVPDALSLLLPPGYRPESRRQG